ncbi:MAG: N-acetylmuramoyl-L-alanine amidase [Opitutaceae bacterium]|nr:N-acetylmuramoyl-L-alanine amidase [Opitutaceae bacterium]
MPPALLWRLALAQFFAVASLADAADAPARATPLRPGGAPAASAAPPGPSAPTGGSLATRKLRGVDYVSLADAATRLGLKLTVSDRGRKARLADGQVRADLEFDVREAAINGLRVVLGDPVQQASGQLYVSRIDFERCLTPLLRPGFGVPPRAAPRVVVLDPGHGGRDPGTSANEKAHALDVARRAKKILEAAGLRVVLTRDADVFLELAERSATAVAHRADLFVSIHFNAVAGDARTSGVEVYAFAPKNQHSTAWWNAPRRADPHPETSEMPVNRYDHWSALLAQSLQRRLVRDLDAADRGHKLARWGMLRGLDCPGVLVECGFLTSTAEAKKIATPAYRQKIAEALATGVRDYVATLAAVRPRAPGASVAGTAK